MEVTFRELCTGFTKAYVINVDGLQDKSKMVKTDMRVGSRVSLSMIFSSKKSFAVQRSCRRSSSRRAPPWARVEEKIDWFSRRNQGYLQVAGRLFRSSQPGKLHVGSLKKNVSVSILDAQGQLLIIYISKYFCNEAAARAGMIRA